MARGEQSVGLLLPGLVHPWACSDFWQSMTGMLPAAEQGPVKTQLELKPCTGQAVSAALLKTKNVCCLRTRDLCDQKKPSKLRLNGKGEGRTAM